MFVLAVTGGIGSGKTEAARHFGGHGAIVLDADAIGRALVLHDPRMRDAIVEAFGPAVTEDGVLTAEALARVAFASDEATRTLDELVHHAVIRELAEGLRNLELLEQPPRVAVIDVPLLAEAPAIAELADHVLAIEAPVEVRVARCVARGMTEDDCRRRLARQAPDEARAALADTVLVNEGTLAEFRAQLDRFWEREVAPDAA